MSKTDSHKSQGRAGTLKEDYTQLHPFYAISMGNQGIGEERISSTTPLIMKYLY